MEIDKLSAKAHKDMELIKLALEGKQIAYAKLMERYKTSVYFTLIKIVNNKYDAEDLTIETFIKAFKNLNSYSPAYCFSTWLFRIATNNGIDFLRKRETKNTETCSNTSFQDNKQISDSLSNLHATSLDPEERIIKEQKELILNETLKRLSPRYRKMVEMRFYKEMSYTEIAEELNLPLGTVKVNILRAKALLANMNSFKLLIFD